MLHTSTVCSVWFQSETTILLVLADFWYLKFLSFKFRLWLQFHHSLDNFNEVKPLWLIAWWHPAVIHCVSLKRENDVCLCASSMSNSLAVPSGLERPGIHFWLANCTDTAACTRAKPTTAGLLTLTVLPMTPPCFCKRHDLSISVIFVKSYLCFLNYHWISNGTFVLNMSCSFLKSRTSLLSFTTS